MVDTSGCCLHCEIGRLNTRFGRALDQRLVDEWVELFTPDATYDNGRVVLHGHGELRPWITKRAAAPDRTTRHVWSQLELVEESDEVVRAESVWVCYAANELAPVDFVAVSSVADFFDVLHRTPTGWRIHERTISTVFRDRAVAPRV